MTFDEASLLITDGLTAKGKPLLDHLMVHDHHQALMFVLEQAELKAPITPRLIQGIGALVMKSTGSIVNAAAGSYDSSKGDFRRSMVRAGLKIFMDYSKVPAAVAELCESVNSRLDLNEDPEGICAYPLTPIASW